MTDRSPDGIIEEFRIRYLDYDNDGVGVYFSGRPEVNEDDMDLEDFLRSAMASAIAWAADESRPKKGFMSGRLNIRGDMERWKETSRRAAIADYHKALITLSEKI